MRMIGVAGLVAALAGASPTVAADWRLASKDDAGRAFVDFATRTRAGNKVTFSTLILFAKPMAAGMDSALTRVTADCADHSFVTLNQKTYGHRRFLRDLGPLPRSVAAPSDRIYTFIAVACGTKAAAHVNDPFATRL